MAGIQGKLVTGEIECASATAKTVLQLIAAANHRVKVTEIGIFLKGIAPTDPPAKVRVLRQTSAGTMSALGPVKNGDYGETLQTSGAHTATAEPSAGDILCSAEVHPQSGWQVFFPYAQEIVVPGGGRVGIEVTLGASPATCNVIAQMSFEE